MDVADIISLLGGLAFFLFGMTLLTDGLKKVAGSSLETILGRLTSTVFRGILLGTVVTAVIQSSSATTVMIVGFVNSGIMKLASSVGIIMGANIGTTATGWILTLAGVDSTGVFSSASIFAALAFVGIILYFFCRKSSQKNVGMILLAFSVLMTGMLTMSGAVEPLKDSPAFLNFMSAASNPLVSLLIGMAVTAIIQSSSASIGILQALSVTGVITYSVAIPMILGMCIGACVPVLLSAIGANVNGKRTALIYLYFNVIGSVILMIPFYLINAFVGFSFLSMTATSIGIAVVNTVYKVLATIILAPFSGLMVKLATLSVRDKSSEDEEEFEENLLDERFLNYIGLAVEQCGKTVAQMVAASFKNVRRSIELLSEFSKEKYEKIISRETVVDRYEDRLSSYLVRINAKELNPKQVQVTAQYLHCVSDIERISDHAENLAEVAAKMNDNHLMFSQKALAELKICTDAIREILDLSQQALVNNDLEAAAKVEPLEEVIDLLTEELKIRHVARLQNGECTLELGFEFNDCVTNFERIADHCSNIAVAVMGSSNSNLQAHDFLKNLKVSNSDDFRKWLDYYGEKYTMDLASVDQNQ